MNGLIPWRGESSLFDEAQRDFDAMLRRFLGTAAAEAVGEPKPVGTAWAPRIDVSETEKAMIVKAEIPGVDPKDVEVTVADGALILRGEKRAERKEEKENFRRSERFFGQFYRSIPLPEGVDAAAVTAQSSKGVVTVTIPRAPGQQPKKIAVKAHD